MTGSNSVDFALEANGLSHRYSGVLALKNVSLSLKSGSFIAILGPNGAGKSTLAKILSGMLSPSSGTLRVSGANISVRREGALLHHGVCLVPEGRRLFGQLTVQENLVLGGYGAKLRKDQIQKRLLRACEILTVPLRESMSTRPAATLSGGERQLVAIARALMADPKVLLVDEPSMGLAPVMIDRIYDIFSELHRNGVTVVVVEQIATHAIKFASNMIVLDRGEVAYDGAVTQQTAREILRAGYLGETS